MLKLPCGAWRRAKGLLCLTAVLLAATTAHALTNAVVNLSHYDLQNVDFAAMKRAGIVGVIHEVTYPPSVRDAKYLGRQNAATRAGLLWGAYHFANATDPVRQADFFVNTVARSASQSPAGVLMVLDFEKNGHYPGGTMTVPQAVRFIERVHQRTGKYPGLYSNQNRIISTFGSSSVTDSQKAMLRRSWLWVANYHYRPGALPPWSHWTMWQYTGDGICDLPRSSYPINIANVRPSERNMYNGSRGSLASFWQANAWRP